MRNNRFFVIPFTALLLFLASGAARLLAQSLQPPPLQLAPNSARLAALGRVRVRAFRFEGNTVFTTAELARVTAPFTGREVTTDELEDARRAVTQFYVNHGYLNSGAVLPDQDVKDGIITLRIVEGVLSNVKISGNRWLRDSYLADRARRWAGTPLNMDTLRDGLQQLRHNPNVAQVNAELKPGAAPGQSSLDLRVTDEQPFRLGVQLDNYRPPSVNAEELLVLAGDRNLTGHSDPFDVTYGVAEGNDHRDKFSGLNNVSASYAVPVTVCDTTLRFFGGKNDYAVIEEPFNALDITSESYRAGVTLRQPVYQTAARELALAVTFERRHSKTFLLGLPFDVTPGSVNGETDISALRFVQEWTDRGQDQVLALRSTFSVGIDAFGATDDGTDRNAKFFAWLGQLQYVRRLFDTPNQLLFRTDAQLTDQPLLSLEQFTIGGANSVRGYRENQLVRDQGVVSSVELRVPVLFTRTGLPVVQLAPFFDFGGGWNNAGPTAKPQTVSSIGAGVLVTPAKHVNAQLYWGYALRHIDRPYNDPQDSGFHFSVTVEAF